MPRRRRLYANCQLILYELRPNCPGGGGYMEYIAKMPFLGRTLCRGPTKIIYYFEQGGRKRYCTICGNAEVGGRPMPQIYFYQHQCFHIVLKFSLDQKSKNMKLIQFCKCRFVPKQQNYVSVKSCYCVIFARIIIYPRFLTNDGSNGFNKELLAKEVKTQL